MAGRFAPAKKGAAQMHRHHAIPIVDGHVGNGLRALDTGIADQDVELAESGNDIAKEGDHVGLPRDIGAHREGTPADRPNFLDDCR